MGKYDEMDRMFFLYHIGHAVLECVHARERRQNRVKVLHFRDDKAAKVYMVENTGKEVTKHDDDTLRISNRVIRLGCPSVKVSWFRKSIVVGPKQMRAYGITNALSSRLRDMNFSISPRHKTQVASKRSMLKLGMDVDGEVKRFASGQLSYMGLKHRESKAIVDCLAERHVSLVVSGVLVSNYQPDTSEHSFSGTEIDLIGYDHDKRCFVVIEVKMTGTKIKHIKDKNKVAGLDKLSGFRRSTLGRYAAQTACSTLMFRNTYNTSKNYPLLVMCEAGTCVCETFKLDESLINCSRFHGWLPGF